MSQHTAAHAFKAAFTQLLPLIEAEWPDLDTAALRATEGDLDKVIALIAERTAHTRTLVARQLDELLGGLARAGTDASARWSGVLDTLEARAAELGARVRKDVSGVEGTLRQNLWVSLLLALGLGFWVGWLARGSHRDG